MLISGGAVVKEAVIWTGSPATWPTSLELGSRWASYAEIYKRQLWVNVLINKRARAVARLPLKTYERGAGGREETRDHPYARLLRRPNERHSRYLLWLWLLSTWDVYGETFLAKQRDRGGRPIALLPMHPTAMHPEDERDGQVRWTWRTGVAEVKNIPSSDLVHIRTYNPDSHRRGLSPLEPLRRTLEFEDAAQRAQSSFWRNGARPGVALSHPKQMSKPAADRLRAQWQDLAGGADNTGTSVVLEEGMKPEVMTISANEAQYIESRKLNREEVCAEYDMPPPVVHILDRATFSNIVEQMRSLYRDTMAPILKNFEEELEFQLRGAVRPGASEPDFGEDVYSEFLLDEVLRGDFEARADATQKAINSGQMTPNEARRLENRPPLPGGDQLYINSTMVPLATDQDDDRAQARHAGEVGIAVQRPGLGVNGALSADEARDLLPGDYGPALLSEADVRTVMGRLSRQTSVNDVDEAALLAGLGRTTPVVLGLLEAARREGDDMAGLRARIQRLGRK